MADLSTRVWELELWSSNGTKLADISGLVENRQLTLQRNEAEQLTFQIDLYRWEAFCASIKAAPRTILEPYQTDVKVKRNGQYLYGLQVVRVTFQLTGSSSSGKPDSGASSFNPSMTVTCTGYLNLFKDRYATASYSGMEATSIASGLIGYAQAQTNGNVGVTLGSAYTTGVNRDRSYKRDNIKQAIQNLTQLVDGRFDFSFDYNKVFRTYQAIGAVRSDLSLVFGGDANNVQALYMDRDATSLFNEVVGIGDTTAGITSTQDNVDSQLANYLRQTINQYNSVSVQATLDQNAAADLVQSKDVLEIPQVTITGNEVRNIPWLSVGDYVPLTVSGHSMLSGINGLYRVEKMDVSIDDNDFESAIVLYFDKLPSGSTLQRLDRLPDGQLVTWISRLRSDLNQLKHS